MRTLGEVLVIVVGCILGILCACALGWFLVMVIAPLGLAVAGLFVALLLTVIGMMSLFRAQR